LHIDVGPGSSHLIAETHKAVEGEYPPKKEAEGDGEKKEIHAVLWITIRLLRAPNLANLTSLHYVFASLRCR
jgi:hypothetical protein